MTNPAPTTQEIRRMFQDDSTAWEAFTLVREGPPELLAAALKEVLLLIWYRRNADFPVSEFLRKQKLTEQHIPQVLEALLEAHREHQLNPPAKPGTGRIYHFFFYIEKIVQVIPWNPGGKAFLFLKAYFDPQTPVLIQEFLGKLLTPTKHYLKCDHSLDYLFGLLESEESRERVIQLFQSASCGGLLPRFLEEMESPKRKPGIGAILERIQVGGNAEFSERWLEFAKDPDSGVRAGCVKLFGALAVRRHVPKKLLEEALQDPNGQVRRRAAEGLASWPEYSREQRQTKSKGGLLSVQWLRRAKKSDSRRKAGGLIIFDEFIRKSDEPKDLQEGKSQKIRGQAWQRTPATRSETSPVLMEAARKGDGEILSALQPYLRSPMGFKLDEVEELLMCALRHPEPKVRMDALRAALDGRPEKRTGRPVLVTRHLAAQARILLEEDQHIPVRLLAVDLLAYAPEQMRKALDWELRDALRNDSGQVRRKAMQYLSRNRNLFRLSFADLYQILHKNTDQEVLELAAEKLEIAPCWSIEEAQTSLQQDTELSAQEASQQGQELGHYPGVYLAFVAIRKTEAKVRRAGWRSLSKFLKGYAKKEGVSAEAILSDSWEEFLQACQLPFEAYSLELDALFECVRLLQERSIEVVLLLLEKGPWSYQRRQLLVRLLTQQASPSTGAWVPRIVLCLEGLAKRVSETEFKALAQGLLSAFRPFLLAPLPDLLDAYLDPGQRPEVLPAWEALARQAEGKEGA